MAKDGGSEFWVDLAELASQEEDPEKVMALVAEINRLLDNKDDLAKDRLAKVNPEIARLLKQKQALLKDGSTKPETE
jgi:ElaB/YqjD/DUF883 family membrane-anchored ribosome-binding protein